MVRKTILFLLLCPVLFGIGCADPDGTLEDRSNTRFTTVDAPYYAEPCSEFTRALPDSLSVPVFWRGSGPLLIVEMSPEGVVATGDIVARGTEPFLSMELERLNMRLEIAQATGNQRLADSLRLVLADPASFVSHISSPGQGRLIPRAVVGDTVSPMQSVATLMEPPPDSIYLLVPLFNLNAWPEGIPECTATDSGLLCRGTPAEGGAVPGFYTLQGRYLHERGLSTFLISTAGDTLPVTVAGSSGQSRVVYSSVVLDSIPLVSWD